MNNLRKNFDIFLCIVKQSLKNELNELGNVPKRGKIPKFSDAEVISLSILAESLMYDSENYLFKMMHNHKKYFPNLIHRSAYNRRRRALYELKERVRQYLVQHMIQGEDTFVIDSMPIQICQFSRSKRIRICKDDYHTSPSYGFCAAQNSYYFGYKLHGVTTVNGIISSFDLSKAEVADIQ